jgi:hypothetical protein
MILKIRAHSGSCSLSLSGLPARALCMCSVRPGGDRTADYAVNGGPLARESCLKTVSFRLARAATVLQCMCAVRGGSAP